MKNHITANFTFAPIVPTHASGSRLWDEENREYIDLSGGIAVNALGHCNPDLVAALNEQALKLWHVSNIYTTQPAQKLAEKLVHHSFADKIFFANSGAEANEAALKLARKFAHDQFGAEKNEIIACVDSFHGRTLFTVSVGGQSKYQQGFAPLPQGICHIPFNDIEALAAAINEKTCAVIIEPIQGESGVLPAKPEFLRAARDLCDRFQAALILDEVQTGMGRTGKLFAYEHYGIRPDILTAAKALGCGVPIGAMLTNDLYAAAFTPGSHGSTFGGNPLMCAVANRAFDIINTQETLAHVQKQGKQLQTALKAIGEEYGIFSQVRGLGLLIGCVLNENHANRAGELVQAALAEKLMILQAGNNVLRFAPSLLLNDKDMNEGIQRLRQAIARYIDIQAA